MNSNYVREILSLVAVLALAQPAWAQQQDHSQHQQTPPAKKESHEGHQMPAPKKEHEGHGDHQQAPPRKDPHEGHQQHQQAPAQKDPHAGHGQPGGMGQQGGHGGHGGHGGLGGAHTNVVMEVPELPILPGADPNVETIPAGPAVRLEEFEQQALGVSPDLARARAEVEAARGRAVQAGLFPNPVVGYSAEEIQSGEPAHGGQHGFAVDQTIPLGGKLSKRRDALLGAVREAEARLEVVRFGVLNTVRLAYFDALAAQQRVDLERRLVALLQEAVRTSYGLYNAGQADKPDVLEIEIEARQSQVRLISARSEMERARQQLAITAGDPAAQFGRLEGSLVSAIPTIEATALQQILSQSPEVTAARASVERAQLAIRAARAERYPDLFFTGGARYNREHREVNDLHFDSLGWQGFLEAGISIPIFNRNQGNISAAEAELRAAEAESRRLELGIRSRFATAFARYRDAIRVSEAYRSEIIPRAEEAYRLYVEKYQEMQAAYPQVLIARRTLLQANLDYIAALEGLYRAGLPLRGFLIEGTGTMSGPLMVSSPGRGTAEADRVH